MEGLKETGSSAAVMIHLLMLSEKTKTSLSVLFLFHTEI